MSDAPLLIETILGRTDASDMAGRLHHLGHHGGRIERLVIAPTDLPRRRFAAETDLGTACFVALPRETALFDGAVLHLSETRAIILHVGQQEWLRLQPLADSALELGYHAGNLHWRVRFEDGCLLVALDGPRETYLARLRALEAQGKVRVLS